MWQSPVGVKNTITQSTYFLNGPMFNLLFYCNIISYWEKVTPHEKFSQNLTLEEVSKCWKIVEFTKISVKMKNCKTFYKAQKSSRLNKIIQLLPNPLHQINLATSFLTEIYRNKRTFAFKVLQECSFVRQETVKCKCFFSDTKEKHVCWKMFSKFKHVFGCIATAYYFQCQVSWGLYNGWDFLNETVL